MTLRSGSFLGLAITDTSIVCSEVVVSKERRVIRRTALFNPTDPLFAKPEASGQALASFLRQHRFRASRAVAGVPARWLLTSEREVPPAAPEEVRAVLRLHAERISLAEHGEMIFDYIERAEADRGGKALLVGILQQQLHRVEALFDSAGLTLIAITPTSVALAAAMRSASGGPMLVLGRQGAELVWQTDGAPRLLRHVPVISMNGHGVPAMGPLGSELRRTMALTPANGSGTPDELLLWDGVGLSDEQRSELAGRSGIALRTDQGIDAMGLVAEVDQAQDETTLVEQYGPAMALALAGARQRGLSIDFKHSRLAPPKKRRFGRRSFWLSAAGATVVLVVAALSWDIRNKSVDLELTEQLIEQIRPRFVDAEKANARFSTAQKYFDNRLPMLECLREITLAFHEDDPAWVTNITLRDTGKGQIVGKSSDQRTPLTIGERLQRNRAAFANAQVTQVIEQQAPGGRGKEQAFTITFEYKGSE